MPYRTIFISIIFTFFSDYCYAILLPFFGVVYKYLDRNPKNGIMLKGIIQIHTSNCIKEDCPLTNFIEMR